MLSTATLVFASQLLSIEIVGSVGGGPGSSSSSGNQTITDSTGAAFLLNAGGNFINLGAVAIGWEIPVLFQGMERNTVSSVPTGSTVTFRETNNWTLTPGLRLRFAPVSPITPWISAGGGVISWERSTIVANMPTTSNTSYGPSISIAGGVDWKLARFLLVRGEIRNYWNSTGEGPLGIFQGDYRSNLLILGGVGIRF